MDTLAVVVSLVANLGTLTQAITYDRPDITSMVPQNAPAGGGVPITLFGKNFGSHQYSQVVTLDGCQNCPSSKVSPQAVWISDSCIKGKMPSGRGIGYDVTVSQLSLNEIVTVSVVLGHQLSMECCIRVTNSEGTPQYPCTVFGFCVYCAVILIAAL